MKISNKIKKYRKDRRLSQEELANLVDVTRQTIISLENGRYIASLPLAYQLARVFGVIIEDLFLFTEEDEED